jgi:hypothetical protein
MYAEFLSSLPDKAVRDTRVTIEQCAALHPTLGLESPETWILFLQLRPDLDQSDRNDIQAIIHRLLTNDEHEFGDTIKQWHSEDKIENKIDEK